MKVFRWELEVTDEQKIDLPLSAQILHVAPGRDPNKYAIDLWAQVPEEAPLIPTTIRIFGTGHSIDNPTRQEYIGTCVMGSFVWHVYHEHNQMEKWR